MTTLKTLLAGAAFVASAAGANAATFVADSVISREVGACTASAAQCASNDRMNVNNAVDGSLDSFYSLGLGGEIVLGFSKLVTAASNTITAFEVTFQPKGDHFEAADIYTILNGEQKFAGTVTNAGGIGNVNASSVTANWTFDSIRLVDVTRREFGETSSSFDGFDIAKVSVAAVPLPAAGLMLMAGLGGLAALRRRKNKAA